MGGYRNYSEDMTGTSYSDAERYAAEHGGEMAASLKHVSEEDRLRACNELNNWEWNEDILGEYKGAHIALAYHRYLRTTLGEYKVLRYHWTHNLGKTEEEFKEWAFEQMANKLL